MHKTRGCMAVWGVEFEDMRLSGELMYLFACPPSSRRFLKNCDKIWDRVFGLFLNDCKYLKIFFLKTLTEAMPRSVAHKETVGVFNTILTANRSNSLDW